MACWFRIGTGPTAETGIMVNSGWITSPTWTVPIGSLADGATYYWRIYVTDGTETVASDPWAFTTNLRLGSGGPSPTDAVGPLSVNLATGNLSFGLSSPQMATVGGPVGVSYAYNSAAPGASGRTEPSISGVGVGQPASPKKTSTARPRATISSSPSRPIRSPSLERGTVVILSTIKLHDSRSPLMSSASTRIRNNGASVGSVVNAQTVTESVASKRSSCTITTGRGFPTYPVPAAAVQISPRLNRHPD